MHQPVALLAQQSVMSQQPVTLPSMQQPALLPTTYASARRIASTTICNVAAACRTTINARVYIILKNAAAYHIVSTAIWWCSHYQPLCQHLHLDLRT